WRSIGVSVGGGVSMHGFLFGHEGKGRQAARRDQAWRQGKRHVQPVPGDKAWLWPGAPAIAAGIEGGPLFPGVLQAFRRCRQLGGTNFRQTSTLRSRRVQDIGSGKGLAEQQAPKAHSFCRWCARSADRDMAGSDAMYDEAFRLAG